MLLREDVLILKVLRSGFAWGTVNGLLFFWLIFAAAGVAGIVLAVADAGATDLPAFFAVLLFSLFFGSLAASSIGGVFGAAFALLDGLLFQAARFLTGGAGSSLESPLPTEDRLRGSHGESPHAH